LFGGTRHLRQGTKSSEGLDPETHVLIEGSRRRRGRPLSRPEWTASLISGGTFLAAAVPMAVLSSSQRSPSIATVGVLVAAYAIASQVEFEVGAGWAVPTQLILVPALFLLPVGTVPLFVACSMVAGDLAARLARRASLDRLVVVPGNAWHAVGPALVLLAAGERNPGWSHWPVYLGALGAQFACDFGNSALREWIAFELSPRSQLGFFRWVWTVDASLAPVGLVFAVVAVSHSSVVLLTLPLLGLLAVFARQRRASIDSAAKLGEAYRRTAFLLADVIEAEDAYTGAHSRDVRGLVMATAGELGLDARTLRHAELTAILHDVGTIGLPSELINKPARLTEQERALIDRHTIEGEQMLERVGGLLGEVGRIVRSCHERWDGSGYPDGLAGEQVPLAARIVACCDAYSAMTDDRPYRPAFAWERAAAELREQAGRQFDPEVVAALLRVLGDEQHLQREAEAYEGAALVAP
jgi:HD-GYP domain-containing protein (c-di-GMP phosphodiesterase class II)